MNFPIIILGGGGHAKVLIDTLLLQRKEILGYTALEDSEKTLSGISRLGDDTVIFKYNLNKLKLVNGLGLIASTSARKQLFERFRKKGYRFESVTHPSAIIASDVRLEEGVQIMAGAVVQSGSRLGANTIINTAAVLDHDCDIEKHVHVAPGAVLSGNVHIEGEVHIGAGAVIIQSLVIGANSVIGAGAVVLKNVPPGVLAIGVPARVVRQHSTK